MKRVIELTDQQRIDALDQIQSTLWYDFANEEWNHDKEWDSSTLDSVSGVLSALGLRPDRSVKMPMTHRNTILAALRLYQHFLFTGKLPKGQQLQHIKEIAGEGIECASPEDIDDICEQINS